MQRSWLSTMAFLLLLTFMAMAPAIMGNPGGVDSDDPEDYGGCGCHGSQGSGEITMDADTLVLKPQQEVMVTVEVTNSQLGDERLIGVFLLRSLTGNGDSPTLDGWTLLADPNGGQEHYVEQVAQDSDTPLEFQWVLEAPAQVGQYQLVTMIDHGGGKGYKGTNDTGLTFVVEIPKEPQYEAHTFPETILVNEPITLTANFTDDDEVEEVYVAYRPVAETEYQFLTMDLIEGTISDGSWTIDLPGQTQAGEVHFDITASDRDHNTICHPEGHIIFVEATGTPLIDHAPVKWVYVDREVPVLVSAVNAPQGVTLFHRGVDRQTFDSLAMTDQGDHNFTASIPAPSLTGRLDYYFVALNGTLNTTTPVFQIEIRPYLDLSVVEVTLSQAPMVGTEVVLTITLRNGGTLPARGVWLNVADEFYAQSDLAYVGLKSNLSIEAQSTLDVQIWWTPQEATVTGSVNETREHMLRISMGYADSQLIDADEANNELTHQVRVAPAGEHEEHTPGIIEQLILGGLLALGALCVVILAAYKHLARGWLVDEQGPEGR